MSKLKDTFIFAKLRIDKEIKNKLIEKIIIFIMKFLLGKRCLKITINYCKNNEIEISYNMYKKKIDYY